ncbi:ChrR family anti-sigma-E factor [Azospirillum sp.]|uniref:ChrR family anti-sigma-E factor n=1 Tax=Azospirillum sp. TaxID=34012 RepID=UPI002D41E03D|nr:ChrR family anti-sigma-E factor [Azospirillum sp.]HYD70763.1 ChrR family anti-sigma-E factor [Azospirillum sp.]
MSLPTHHPGDALLMDYAGGCLPEPAALVLATHMALCPGCRHAVAELETVGGALLEELEPDPVSACCRDAVFARLDEAADPMPTRNASLRHRNEDRANGTPLLPQPLRRYVGDVERLRWRTKLPGIQIVDLPLSGGSARLVRMRGGAAAPRHSHEGMELAVILAGGFSDSLGHFLRGDVAIGDDSVDHKPVADPEGCLCLSVTLGRLRLTGPLGRLIDPFVTL